MTRIEIRTTARLHFGLLGWGADAPRQFGGVGLMIEAPSLDLEARLANGWSAAGPLSTRALRVALRIADRLETLGVKVPPLSITIREGPPEHVGLGTGTQLSLAVGRAVLGFVENSESNAGRVAELTGRGRRSGIGLHGFDRGGLLVDGGRGSSDAIPPLVARHEFPSEWSILLVIPSLPPGLSGHDEVEAFRGLRPVPSSLTDRLCRLILLEMFPAVAERNLPSFGSSLVEIQEHVGRCFASVQGGRFAHPLLDEIAARMVGEGLHGVGQSSWGPTIYGFTDEPEARFGNLVHDLRESFGIGPNALVWTRGRNHGSSISEY